MALFGSKKNTDTANEENSAKETRVTVPQTRARVLLRPRITEKASLVAEIHNVYTFEVPKNVTKDAVRRAVKEFYNVTPVKVAIVNLPAKRVMSRAGVGTKRAVKKAHVYLKKGDKIEFV
jgi:large subunit ribosomal protein L23